MKLLLVGICVALVSLAATFAAPRFDEWKIIGPGGGGQMFLPTVSPHDASVVLERCDMTGSYISRDAGRSWRMFNLRGVVSAFAFDPQDAKTIYAGNHALWRSEDTGRTWRMLFPDPARNTVEHMRGDHAEPSLTTGDPAYPANARVRCIAVDPVDPRRLYVAFEGGQSGTVLCASQDRGATWSRARELPGERVLAICFDHGVRVVGETGVYMRMGEQWEHLPGPPGERIQAACGGPGLLYVTSFAGIHTSEDGGRSWRAAETGLPGSPRLRAIACSAEHPETAYVSYASRPSSGIAKTTDRGRHWTPVYESSGRSASNVEDGWIETFFGGTGPVLELGVAPGNPEICYATDPCPRSFRTLDGGRTWQQVVSRHVEGGRWTTTGFDVTTCYGVHFDPFDAKRMFISYTDIGLFRSEDAGATWQSSIDGLSRRWRNTTYWVAFDPKVKGLMWGAFARTHDLPRPKMWRRADPDSFEGGVGTSTDGGEHWTVTNTGMPETAVTHILLDPASPVGSRTLYACGFGRGVYKSTDNGKNWTLKTAGIEQRQPFAWRITRAEDGTLYLVVARRTDDGQAAAAGEEGALYRSTDGAEHWVKMTLPAGVNGPTGLTLDPSDHRRMYLSAWRTAQSDGITGGVFLSTDAGETWRRIFDASQHVYDVTVDLRNPRVLYNCGFENGAYRSLDGGAVWTRLRGFNFKWGHRDIPDPADPAQVYVTTFGGSVWHGPAAGDPQAAEDVVTAVKTAP